MSQGHPMGYKRRRRLNVKRGVVKVNENHAPKPPALPKKDHQKEGA